MFAQCCLCDRLPASTGVMKVNQSEAWGGERRVNMECGISLTRREPFWQAYSRAVWEEAQVRP